MWGRSRTVRRGAEPTEGSRRGAPADVAALPVIGERLRARRAEIEEAMLARVHGVPDPAAVADPEYLHGLRAAVGAGLEYGLAAIATPARPPEPVPLQLLSQARLAARHGVDLQAVVRRYAAGHSLLSDALLEEAASLGTDAEELRATARALSASYEYLLAAVTEAYAQEAKRRPAGGAARRAEQIERLLAGELLDPADLGYELGAHHLGAVARGPEAADALRDLARLLDRRLLVLPRGDDCLWAWLGGRDPLEADELSAILAGFKPPETALALGEPGQGLAGWRLTHRQAAAAFPVAQHGSEPIVRYADVALLASVLRDDLLATSLCRLYMEPLESERDGGETLRQTLSAYFAAERNATSAAAILGVNRQTVTRRLGTIERMVGRPLRACAVELEAALRLRSQGTRPV